MCVGGCLCCVWKRDFPSLTVIPTLKKKLILKGSKDVQIHLNYRVTTAKLPGESWVFMRWFGLFLSQMYLCLFWFQTCKVSHWIWKVCGHFPHFNSLFLFLWLNFWKLPACWLEKKQKHCQPSISEGDPLTVGGTLCWQIIKHNSKENQRICGRPDWILLKKYADMRGGISSLLCREISSK